MIYITGDIHGDYDIRKLSSSRFHEQKKLTRSDYLIICGDFGLIWDGSKHEKYWRRWLERKPWTTLWIDGNHENFDMLEQYPVEEWHGGNIQKISEHVYHLCRGNMFDIDGLKIFAFGGASSHDKEYRQMGISMWEQELPNEEEIEYGRQTLEKNNWQADIVITHSLSTKILESTGIIPYYERDRLTDFFSELDEKLNFSLWFSGHYHCTCQCSDRHHMIYNDIVRITEN